MKKYTLLLFIPLLFSSCHTNSLTGTWIQPIPGQAGHFQGFTLEKDGKASSVNMHTLSYESWEQNGDLLILNGKSTGNGLTIPFSDTLTIEKAVPDTLILKKQSLELVYTRSKNQ